MSTEERLRSLDKIRQQRYRNKKRAAKGLPPIVGDGLRAPQVRTPELIQRAAELRAEGLSFRAIDAILGVKTGRSFDWLVKQPRKHAQ